MSELSPNLGIYHPPTESVKPKVELPNPEDILGFVLEQEIPSPTQLEKAQAWVLDAESSGTFHANGHLLAEDGSMILDANEYASIKDYFEDTNWLMSGRERLLLEQVAAAKGRISRAKEEPTNPTNSVSDVQVYVAGISRILGEDVEAIVASKSVPEQAEAFNALANNSLKLLLLDAAIRGRMIESHEYKGRAARKKREQIVADKTYAAAFDKKQVELKGRVEKDPTVASLDAEGHAALLAHIVNEAEKTATEAKNNYLSERQKIFEANPREAALRHKPSLPRGEEAPANGEVLVRPGYDPSRRRNVKVATLSEQRLEEWDREHAAEIDAYTVELMDTIARGLGEITVLKANGKLEESAVTRFLRTLEEPKQLSDSTYPNGRFVKGKQILKRPMRLTRAQATARRNAAYHSGKKRLSRRQMQLEINNEVTADRTEFWGLGARKREYLARLEELQQERERLAYDNATSKLFIQLAKL